jgi:hypothetical protein
MLHDGLVKTAPLYDSLSTLEYPELSGTMGTKIRGYAALNVQPARDADRGSKSAIVTSPTMVTSNEVLHHTGDASPTEARTSVRRFTPESGRHPRNWVRLLWTA